MRSFQTRRSFSDPKSGCNGGPVARPFDGSRIDAAKDLWSYQSLFRRAGPEKAGLSVLGERLWRRAGPNVETTRQHPLVSALERRLSQRQIDRREFLRAAALLGLSASSAYGYAIGSSSPGRAAEHARPMGGTLRIAMSVQDVSSPHSYEWWEHNITRNVCEYLTLTGHDNITRPYLAERWEASDDLKSWTLRLRQDVNWHSGRRFTAEDVDWNIRRVLDERTGSSVRAFMQSYMLDSYEEGGQVHSRLWDESAIEILDSHTVRLNCREPQLAVPEHLFHYPFLMLDPEDEGRFGPGANGTGAFSLVEFEVGKIAVLEARPDYWGSGPYVDRLEFVDLGEDPAAAVDALAARRVHGLHFADTVQLDALQMIPHLRLYSVPTADTAVVRGKVTQKPFDDPRVRRALRMAVDPVRTNQIIMGDLGVPAEHHHVSPIHSDYAPLPATTRDVAAARQLLADAGYPEGVDLGKIDCKSYPSWEFNTVQALVEQWKDAGIRCKVNLMPPGEFYKIWNTTALGFTEWAHRPLGVMVLELAYRSGAAWNESEFSNPVFDRLLTEAGGILDTGRRREVMREIQEIMQLEGPIVQPIWRSVATVMDKRVSGFAMHPTKYIFGNELSLET